MYVLYFLNLRVLKYTSFNWFYWYDDMRSILGETASEYFLLSYISGCVGGNSILTYIASKGLFIKKYSLQSSLVYIYMSLKDIHTQ